MQNVVYYQHFNSDRFARSYIQSWTKTFSMIRIFIYVLEDLFSVSHNEVDPNVGYNDMNKKAGISLFLLFFSSGTQIIMS